MEERELATRLNGQSRLIPGFNLVDELGYLGRRWMGSEKMVQRRSEPLEERVE